MFNKSICIVGGAGHVGAPLGLAFSSKGYKVVLIDKNIKNIKKINNGKMPFLEDGCEILLKKMIGKKRIIASDDLTNIKKSKYIIICLGTPVYKKFNPILKISLIFFIH